MELKKVLGRLLRDAIGRVISGAINLSFGSCLCEGRGLCIAVPTCICRPQRIFSTNDRGGFRPVVLIKKVLGMDFEDKSDSDIDYEKKILRVIAEKKRQLLCRRDAQKASMSIVQNFFESWLPPLGSIVSAFWPFRAELDVRPLIYRLKAEGYTIALPQVIAKATPLLFREWEPATPLLADKYGVLCLPDTSAIIEPDWLLVPLLAFDKNGYRLGYGGGFYDLTLTKLRKEKKIFAIGVAYECQLVSRVPHTKRDVRLDAILTEGQIFNIKD